jgi:hypothetical protein
MKISIPKIGFRRVQKYSNDKSGLTPAPADGRDAPAHRDAAINLDFEIYKSRLSPVRRCPLRGCLPYGYDVAKPIR